MYKNYGITVTFCLPLAQINLRDILSACVHAQAGRTSYLPLRRAQAGGDYVEQLTYLLFLKMADILSKIRDRRIII
ncbi:MAG: hypothetical protein U9Q84_10455 [Thermodesulfobacteriota bacterium]|nr:hypothetical protein [Thermodesulfobacteriota bacterium]